MINEIQIEELKRVCNEPREVEPSKICYEGEDKTICECMYSSVEHLVDMHYDSFGIDLPYDEEILWVVAEGKTEDVLEYKDKIKELVNSIT